MSAPTEAEIRASFRAVVDEYVQPHHVEALSGECFGGLILPWHDVLERDPDEPEERGPDAGELWADLRRTEALDMKAIYLAARAEAATAVLRALEDVYVRTALEFAAKHPDAPRARVAVTAD